MGTRPLLIALLLLVGPAVHPVPLAAQEAPKAGPNWSVEVFGGLAPVDPRDLNAWSLNREAVYGSSSTTTSGEFPLLDHGRTIGVRAAWHISRRIALAAGFDYLSGTTRSESIHREWETTSLNPDAVAFPSVGGLTSDFTEAFSVRSYEPWIGVRLAVWRHGPFSAEGIAQGGATRASVQLEETGAQTASPYMQRATWSHRMEGTGWHPSGEAGIRAGWEATRRLGAFIEISYKYDRVVKVVGSVDHAATRQDGDATTVEYETRTSASGQWRMLPYRATVQGTAVDQPYPGIGGDQNPGFALDLSGARVRFGFALRFGGPTR